MRKFLLIYSASATLLLAGGVAWLRHTTTENGRLRRNQVALTSEIEHYTSRHGEAVATIQALELRIAEFRSMHEEDAKRIRELDIALRRANSLSTVASATTLTISAPLTDTVAERKGFCADIAESILHRPLLDSAKVFRWSDNWVNIEGVIRNDKVDCRIESIDTLRQIVHRVPRKFLFFRFGVKAIRQEIISSNPHSKIVYAEYIDLRRRK